MSPAARGIPLGPGLDDTAASIHQPEVHPMASKSNTNSTKTTTENTETKRSPRGTSINRVTLVGRLVATPELRTTASGVHVTTSASSPTTGNSPSSTTWSSGGSSPSSPRSTWRRVASPTSRDGCTAAPGKLLTAPSDAASRWSPTGSRRFRPGERLWRLRRSPSGPREAEPSRGPGCWPQRRLASQQGVWGVRSASHGAVYV